MIIKELIMSDWYAEFENDFFQQLKDAKARDLRFFRVEEYLRNVQRVDAFSSSCRECQSFRHEIEKHKDTVARAVNEPGRERRAFDRLQSGLSEHMKKEHGFYPPYYYTYLYVAGWSAALLALAVFWWWLVRAADIFVFLAPAFAIGVVTGQVIGGKKDRRVRDENKLL